MHGPTNPLSLPALRAVIAGVHQKSLKLDGYGFECEGGPLTHCRDWTELRTDLTTLADACERLAEENERMRGADRTGLMTAVRGELDHAYAKHGRDPWGRHEFYAILLEEVEELWAEIKADAPQEKVLAELRQVAAMCFRYAETGDRYRGEHPPIPSRITPAPAGKGEE